MNREHCVTPTCQLLCKSNPGINRVFGAASCAGARVHLPDHSAIRSGGGSVPRSPDPSPGPPHRPGQVLAIQAAGAGGSGDSAGGHLTEACIHFRFS